MDDKIGELLLEEFRELRSTVVSWQQENGERLSKLETEVRSGISGNGQPSRLTILETKVDDLSSWRWRIVGISAGISGIIALFGWLIPVLAK